MIDTLTSCLIDPKPLVTIFVVRKSLPNAKAIFFISDGVPIIGSEAISTSGIPKRSRLYSLVESLSSSSLAASSSRQID